MSGYGHIQRPSHSGLRLPTKVWPSRSVEGEDSYLYTFHLTLLDARRQDGLVEYLYSVFSDVVEEGLTYPQEELSTQSSFESYFFSADVILAITESTAEKIQEGQAIDKDLLSAVQNERTWADCVGGFYYIKPNYPGRSSHICNAGFVVPPAHRGRGYGAILARTFLDYGPRLGYEASVFNLVYANNVASIKLWDRLGFARIGLIPRAGRLRCTGGDGEEYIDAIIYYKRFNE